MWQAAVHSCVAGLVLYAWARQVGLPPGRAKRRLLAVLLVLPLLTAGVPGRSGPDFRERLAWLDSGRLLAIPLPGGARVAHLALLVGGMMVVLTVTQEVLPALRRRRTPAAPAPARLCRLVGDVGGWEGCPVAMRESDEITLAATGWPWRPRLVVSRGALERLTDDELAAALRHERAHTRPGRWALAHALFLVRLAQAASPVALWSFREYCLELEIACDAEAVADGDPAPLARALLKVYEATDPRDVAARSALRRRIECLLEPGRRDDHALPPATVGVAAVVLALVLPWIV